VRGLSTYRKPLSIVSIRSNDERIVPVIRNHTLEPNVNTTLASIMLDPGKLEPFPLPLLEDSVNRRRTKGAWFFMGAREDCVLDANFCARSWKLCSGCELLRACGWASCVVVYRSSLRRN
jgi:hypothetical protein